MSLISESHSGDLALVAERRNIGFIKVAPANASGYYFYSKDPVGAVESIYIGNQSQTRGKAMNRLIDRGIDLSGAAGAIDANQGGQRFEYHVEYHDDRLETLQALLVEKPELQPVFKDQLEALKKLNPNTSFSV